ncbi:S-methyl-5-thioribose-1-phosphate isomerase [Methylophaga sp. OBS4]|uniref:S-methyl-5-thioribose-1-phosphate isomerase n=1 Tax=Methylophaga sp. OBS4 TaxID=2991935 RepID=UPI0022587731|nr:S-methyl-5-thioribose-1-phosphate isomerase [Methylophaga sp. OBS4]MCX4187272.1 S-methyl-5-thioribose-1-phosphate isomerase [Methylophaga sp. OBS4]
MASVQEAIEPIIWRDNRLHLLDQRQLPHMQVWLDYDHPTEVAEAIQLMVVRGAPAIGVTAAYGVVLAGRQAWSVAGVTWKQAMTAPLAKLENARPTAVNLFWAIEHMRDVYRDLPDDQSPEPVLLEEAIKLHQQDIAANQAMGRLGAELLNKDSVVLTHCNAGALATAGFGTALGVIRQAYLDGKIDHVYVNETRPWLQGSRLTAWELMQEGIPMILQADSAAAALMASGKLDWVIVGADRIAANGDVANKIGTYALAVLAKYHGVKMMVAAPTTTIDWDFPDGSAIPIEQRDAKEVTHVNEEPVAPNDVNVSNPAFDVTPAELIDAIVTEAGVILSPTTSKMLRLKPSV